MNETLATDQEILTSIQRITLFLDEKGSDHTREGILLLKAEHPSLTLCEGEIDLIVVNRNDAEEGQAPTFSVGWIGGGRLKGIWAEDSRGTIIDPWLDERVRRGAAGEKMEPLPVVYRGREHSGPLDVVYHDGSSPELTDVDLSIRTEYRKWLDNESFEKAVPTRVRVVLNEGGLAPIAEHSLWAQAVLKVDQHGIPPMRAPKASVKAEETPVPVAPMPSETPKAQSPAANKVDEKKAAKIAERREIVAEAVTDMTTKRPLSFVKAVVAASSGIAIGYGIIHLFG